MKKKKKKKMKLKNIFYVLLFFQYSISGAQKVIPFITPSTSMNQTRARRVLVVGLPRSGASLFTASLLQLHNSVGVTDVDPSGVAPRASDFVDVPSPMIIVLRVTPSSRHTIADYCDAFRPDVKIGVVRHPAHHLQALNSDMPATYERSLKHIDQSINYKRGRDIIIFFESLFRCPVIISDPLP